MTTSFKDVLGFPYRINIADLESIYREHQGPLSSEDGSLKYQYGNIQGTFANSDIIKHLIAKTIDAASHYSGYGGSTNTLQNFLLRIDRYGNGLVPTNSMYRGFTFITRPRLNLTGANLHQHSLMNTLYTANERSVAFMIRALLDTRLANGEPLLLGSLPPSETITDEVLEFSEAARKSPLFDVHNPFFTPLMNGLVGISGFPDLTLQTESTQGDFHGGDFTYAKGSDLMNRTEELSLEFRDIGGSIILSCMYYWCMAIALLAKGVMLAYPDDIYERRLNYTVSIYRFITDRTGTQVQWWAKATGCFPKSVPVGALFNISQGESLVASARNFTIPFVANNFEVNDVGTLFDFNALMRRYQPDITNENEFISVTNGCDPEHSFNSLPYLVTDSTGIRLDWRTSAEYLTEDYVIQNGKVIYQPQVAIEEEMGWAKAFQDSDIEEALRLVGIDPELDIVPPVDENPKETPKEETTIDGSELPVYEIDQGQEI